MIDAATRYTATCLIRRRKKELVVSHISDMGCLFWSTFKFYSDYGGGICKWCIPWNKQKIRYWELSFSNGVIEMNNKVLYEALMKQEDGKCNMETALACVESW